MKIVCFGTSSFAAEIFTYLVKQDVTVCAIVTRPDKPKGRSAQLLPPPVKETASRLFPSIPLHQPKKASTNEFAALLKQYDADLFVVVAYGEILKENILKLPKLSCINIHASLLPLYRGAAPMQRALMDGVTKSGITIIDMVLEMDAGDILAKAEIEVSSAMTYGELHEKLSSLACPLVLETIKNFNNHSVKRVAQDQVQVTFAPKITPSEEEIHWDRSAVEIHNQIRALSPQPGAWCRVQVGKEVKRLKIKRSVVISDVQGFIGETLSFGKEGWVIACGSGALRLLEVQLEGKKNMPVEQFLPGYSSLRII